MIHGNQPIDTICFLLLTEYRGLSIGLSVCHTSEPCKDGQTDRDAIWVEDSGGCRDHVLDGGPDPPLSVFLFGK